MTVLLRELFSLQNHVFPEGNESCFLFFPPVPADEKVKVTNLQATKFVEDKDSNTFAVNFTWDPPLFQYRIVRYYNLSYVFSGYQRDQFPCPGALVKEHGCKITGIVSIWYLSFSILFWLLLSDYDKEG